MKTITTFVCIFLFSFTQIISAQCVGGLTTIDINTFGAGQNITFTDPVPPHDPYTGYAGTVNSTMDGNPMPVYCVDLHRNVNLPDNSYTDTCATVEPRIQYILNHYYPYIASYPTKLPDNNMEAAAIQAAVWSYTDNVDVSTISDGTINTRAVQIVADANANGNITPPVITFSLEASMESDQFYVKTVDDHGAGVAVPNITLAITSGTLGTYTTSTDASGISPDITATGTGIITATANMLYSQGRIVHSVTLTKQSLTIAYPVYGMMEVSLDWGALPVELSSFAGSTNGRNVELNWITSNERNNSGFNVERRAVGNNEWTKVGNVQGHGNSDNSVEYSFEDRNIATGKYNYRLKQIDFNGNFEYHNLNSEIEVGMPMKFNLSQNYPNPFNPSTKINFDIVNDGFVTLKIYNTSGKEVATLVNGFATSGYHTITFDATNLSSGVYYYKLEANGMNKVMKMALVK